MLKSGEDSGPIRLKSPMPATARRFSFSRMDRPRTRRWPSLEDILDEHSGRIPEIPGKDERADPLGRQSGDPPFFCLGFEGLRGRRTRYEDEGAAWVNCFDG